MKPPFVWPATCLITKGDADTANYPHSKKEIVRQIIAAVEAGVSIVQIREKRLNARQIFEITREAVAAASQSDTVILVNERFDIALAAGADGVHLPSDSVSASLVRRFTPRGFVIGVSAHTLDEVLD